jgi:hypothetical protein
MRFGTMIIDFFFVNYLIHYGTTQESFIMKWSSNLLNFEMIKTLQIVWFLAKFQTWIKREIIWGTDKKWLITSTIVLSICRLVLQLKILFKKTWTLYIVFIKFWGFINLLKPIKVWQILQIFRDFKCTLKYTQLKRFDGVLKMASWSPGNTLNLPREK